MIDQIIEYNKTFVAQKGYETPPLYKILSNVFFAIWLVRLVVIRKRYYKIGCTNTQ